MKVVKKHIDGLKPLVENVRKHNPVQIKEMMRSLDQFGQTRPMVIDEEGNILVGNGLYMAMKERGDSLVDCYEIAGLTEAQKKKLILTDNKVYSLGQDDYDVIDKFISEITIDAGDFDIAGFDEDVLRSMTRDVAAVTDDIMNYGKSTVPEVQSIEVAPHEPVQPTQGVESTEQVKSIAQPASNAPKAAQSEMHDKAQMTRSVVCPCCGEVIYLD